MSVYNPYSHSTDCGKLFDIMWYRWLENDCWPMQSWRLVIGNIWNGQSISFDACIDDYGNLVRITK